MRGARARALQQLWVMIYCARPQLLAYFNREDHSETGVVSLTDWVAAMRACVIEDDDFPWMELAKHLASFDRRDRCHYGHFLARYTNTLAVKLEKRWCTGAFHHLLADVGDEKAGAVWNELDVDRTGHVSYRELRPFIKRHLDTRRGNKKDDDDATAGRVYTILSRLDHNHSGYVDKDEFIRAAASSAGAAAEPPPSGPAGLYAVSDGEDDFIINQCWSALQRVLHLLCAERCRMEIVFRAMDTDQDGYLTRTEFQKGLKHLLNGTRPLTTIEQWEPLLWYLVDDDKSGMISHAEFVEALRVRDARDGL